MRYTLAATVLLGAAAFAQAAQAKTVAALIGDDTLAIVDTKSGSVAAMTKISGLSAKVLGIDVRPADGMLYALAEDGTVATIDPKTGKAEMKSKLETVLPRGVMATVDFNPVADRLRVMGSDGTNLRANVDDGKVTTDGMLKFAEADANKGKAPMIVAGAYTNSVKGAKETGLYNIDGGLGAFTKQVPPNDGVQNTIGMLGVTAKAYAFDILSDGNGGNTAFLMADDQLYTVDLATGKASAMKKIAGLKGTVRDIAVLPTM